MSQALIVNVDKRITLEDFKKELEPYVGLSSENFKVSIITFNILILSILHFFPTICLKPITLL